MKKLLSLFLLLLSIGGYAQNIGIGTNTPDPSAQLDVSSTQRGFLPPRMTFAQRNAIVNPAAGLIIYCTDCGQSGQLLLYSGGAWVSLQPGTVNVPAAAHTCGADSVHNPAKTYGTMTDQQGNVYKTIVIGNQEWMAENLKTTIYRNGNTIPNVTDATQWAGLTTGAWCSYDNNSQNDCPYGKLYNWYAVVDSRNLCPTGWHVPSDDEWTTLTNTLGGEPVAGGKMKSNGTQYWVSPNTSATNESGFAGLPGGLRYSNGPSYGIGPNGGWWSSSQYSAANAWYRFLGFNYADAYRDYNGKASGLSVRCVRD